MASEIQQHSDECEPGEDLRPSQIRAITALMESPSIVAAAEKAKLSERTIRRWLRDDERFQDALRHVRTEALSQASLQLHQCASAAVEKMHDMLKSDKPVDSPQVSLIRCAIDFAFKAGAYSDLAERIHTLEGVAARKKKR